MADNDIKIYGALRAMTGDGIAAYAEQIYDEESGKYLPELLEESGGGGVNQAQIGYFVCDTAATTAAKTIAATGYALTTGGNIRIKMTNANTADAVTLNINNTGAKALFYNGAQASSANSWEAGEVIGVYYDGTCFMASNSQGGGGDASKIKYDNSQSELTADNVQEAIDKTNEIFSIESFINTYAIQKNNKYISSSNVWVSSDDNINSINIPVKAGENYMIESNPFNGSIYALLKSDTSVDDPVNFSSELNHRVVLSAGQKTNIIIPSDTTILYLFVHTGSYEFLPSKLIKKDRVSKIVNNIYDDDIENKNKSIPNMVALEQIYKDEIINLSLYNLNSRYISSSNEWEPSNHNRSISIPVNAGDIYIIESNSDKGSSYALLKSDTDVGNPVDFSDSLNHRVVLSAGQSIKIYIPDDTTILNLFAETIGGTRNFLPSRLVRLSKITKAVELLDASTPRFVFKKGVMMGDSITAGVYSYFNNGQRWNGVQADNGISDYIGDIIGCEIDNVGKRGSGYVIDTRNVNNALEQAMVTDYSQYDLCIMMYGVNDYIRSAPIGNLTDNIEGTVMGNMSRVFEKILNDNPYCKILCVGSYNTWGQVSQGGDYISEEYYGDATTDYGLGYAINGKTLRQYFDAQQEVCEHYHVQYFCLADEGIVNTFNIKNVLVDGLHPTLELRKYIAQEIAKHLV